MIKTRWSTSSLATKIGFVVALLALVSGLAAGAYWVLRDDYQVLFADLANQDAAAMVAELDRMKIPYRLADDGATVLVERELVYKTRLKLMAKGIDLHGGVGLEIFNNADFGMTEFVQKVNYQRAMQGELARTISGFDEVKSARVHLVLPESGLFKRQNAKPKASISLVMKDSAQLAPEQIAGIQRLVAASVPEITPSAVTIVDQRGVALSGIAADNEVDESYTGRLDTKKRIEDYLTRKIVSVLDRAIGPGKSIVSVDVVIDYNQIKVTKEDIVPLANTSGQNVGAISRRRESIQGSDDFASLPASTVRGTLASPSTSGSSSSETEFVTGRRVENIVSTPGNLHRLSVGVLVPGITDPVELAKLREVVTMAVGIDTERGDAIAVYSVSPPTVDAPVSISSEASTPVHGNPDTHRTAVASNQSEWLMALTVAVVLLMLAVVGRRRMGQPQPAAERLSSAQREDILREVAQWATSQKP